MNNEYLKLASLCIFLKDLYLRLTNKKENIFQEGLETAVTQTELVSTLHPFLCVKMGEGSSYNG